MEDQQNIDIINKLSLETFSMCVVLIYFQYFLTNPVKRRVSNTYGHDSI